jgi:hypothetical protein
LLLLAGVTGFQFLDTMIGAHERLILQQYRLHQRVHRIGGSAQPLGDGRNSIRIAW